MIEITTPNCEKLKAMAKPALAAANSMKILPTPHIKPTMAFLKTKELWPLSLYLPNIELKQAGFAFAASVVALAPAVLVFLSGQDYLEQGIVSTAVKE